MSQTASRRDVVRAFTDLLLADPSQHAKLVQSLAAYLIVHKMEADADLIINDIAYELFQKNGQLTVEVVSARQLNDALRDSLRDMLQAETGAADVVLHETTDQALLGGFVARTPDAEIDASVRTKLKKLASLA